MYILYVHECVERIRLNCCFNSLLTTFLLTSSPITIKTWDCSSGVVVTNDNPSATDDASE